MQRKQVIAENTIFVDVQETLIKGTHTLNNKLYDNMIIAQEHGADVVIFTLAAPTSTSNYLKSLGVDTNRFPVHNKLAYKGHLFTGLIIDDIPPHLQGFLTKPNVYDHDGNILSNIATQLSKSPRLTFATALRNHRLTQNRILTRTR